MNRAPLPRKVTAKPPVKRTLLTRPVHNDTGLFGDLDHQATQVVQSLRLIGLDHTTEEIVGATKLQPDFVDALTDAFWTD
jgi:hypothetical protein